MKTIGWNGLNLSVPTPWEAIVRGPYHLILEQDLRPVLEIRWHGVSKNGPDNKQAAKIIAQLQKGAGKNLIAIAPPDALKPLRKTYHMDTFSWDDMAVPALALLTCNVCSTLILMHFFADSAAWLQGDDVPAQSLRCHNKPGSNTSWSIQDVSFSIPEDFSLDTFSFSFGLSKFMFRSSTTALALCRLAPASKHLRETSLAHLFSSFSGCSADRQLPVNTRTLTHAREPTALGRVSAFLRRKRPYEWSQFEHLPDHDRILGIHLMSSRPVQSQLMQLLQTGYGMV